MHREFFAVHIYQDEFHRTMPQASFHEANASFHVVCLAAQHFMHASAFHREAAASQAHCFVDSVAHIYHNDSLAKFIYVLKAHFMRYEVSRFMISKSFHVRSTFHSLGGLMSENLVLDLSMQFAIDVVNLCETLKGKSVLTNQLLRSGTSIGANIHEANYASSKADFIAKMQIALKECHETEYWLKLFVKTNIISDSVYGKMSIDSGKIRRILISSINTAKNNL